jgi:hypothetical protein
MNRTSRLWTPQDWGSPVVQILLVASLVVSTDLVQPVPHVISLIRSMDDLMVLTARYTHEHPMFTVDLTSFKDASSRTQPVDPAEM